MIDFNSIVADFDTNTLLTLLGHYVCFQKIIKKKERKKKRIKERRKESKKEKKEKVIKKQKTR